MYDIFGIVDEHMHLYLTHRSKLTHMQWDPKRQCQEGDCIAYDKVVYDAVSNSWEGPFFGPFLRAVRNLLCGELDHPSSSYILPYLLMGCVVLASMLLS